MKKGKMKILTIKVSSLYLPCIIAVLVIGLFHAIEAAPGWSCPIANHRLRLMAARLR